MTARLRPPSETIKHLGNSSNPEICPNYLPTKLCFLLSHSGAALTPFATKAKKAFFTCKQTNKKKGKLNKSLP